MNLRVGIVGMGRMGEIRKSTLDSHKKFSVVAVSDVNEELSLKYGSLFLRNWRDVLNQELDCLFVCTFNDIIPEIVCAALEKGVHVFSEKPPGKTTECINKMKIAEASSGKVLKFGFNHRHHYSVIEAKRLVESGEYGKILWARGVYGKAGSADFEKIWRSDKDKAGGGILLDQGIHMLDLIRYFLGDIVEVKSMVDTLHWNIDLEDNAFALLKSKNGARAMIHSSATHWKHHFSLEIGLEEGLIVLDGILSNSMTYGPETIKVYKKNLLVESGCAVGKPPFYFKEYTQDNSWKLELDEFYEAISGGKVDFQGTSSDAYSVMELIDWIYNDSKFK